jgi:hypothetical protein
MIDPYTYLIITIMALLLVDIIKHRETLIELSKIEFVDRGEVFERTNENNVADGLEEVIENFVLINKDNVALRAKKHRQCFCWAKFKETRTVLTGNEQTSKDKVFDEGGVFEERSRAFQVDGMLSWRIAKSRRSDKL